MKLLLLLVLLLSPACGRPEADRDQDGPREHDDLVLREIGAMLQGSAEAWNAGNLDGFLSDYLDDPGTVYMGRSGPLRGLSAIRSRYAPDFAPRARRDSLAFDRLQVRSLGPRFALATARYTLRRGDSVTSRGPFTLVLERQGGRWKIIHDHTHSETQ